jgi:hypothetical protein
LLSLLLSLLLALFVGDSSLEARIHLSCREWHETCSAEGAMARYRSGRPARVLSRHVTFFMVGGDLVVIDCICLKPAASATHTDHGAVAHWSTARHEERRQCGKRPNPSRFSGACTGWSWGPEGFGNARQRGPMVKRLSCLEVCYCGKSYYSYKSLAHFLLAVVVRGTRAARTVVRCALPFGSCRWSNQELRSE